MSPSLQDLENTLLTACMDEAAIGMVVLDQQKKIGLWNRWMEKASGLQASFVLGKSLLELFPELAGGRLLAAVEDAANRGLPAILSHKLNMAPLPLYPPSPRQVGDDQRMSQLIIVSGMAVSGLSRYVLLQVQDVTHTVFRERQLRQQTQDLQVRAVELREAQQLAQRASMAKSDFLANMSHEIRTPLNAVLGLTNLALQASPDVKMKDYLEKIHTSGRYLLGLINDILDFSKIEAGKLELENTSFNLQNLMARVVERFAPQAAQKGLELCLSTHPFMAEEVVGDPLRLEQVLTNLINNAIKFTNKGEVVVSVFPAPSPAGEASTQYLQFVVQDTGIGIAGDQIGLLFQPFTQADSSTTRHFGGTGLGLTISKRLVELMGGEIHATSQVGEGSRFSFTARFQKSGPVKASSKLVLNEPILMGLPILVVDDNLTSCQILQETLYAFKFIPTVVHSGAEALSLFARGHHFPLVIMDWRMPGVDGMMASRLLIEKYRNPRGEPRIILLSAYYQEKLCKDARQIGINQCLTKPTTASSLWNTILEVLGKRQVQANPDLLQLPSDTGFLANKHILVVEDNLINQQVAQELLQKAGATITIAANGRQALSQVQAIQVDAILMDIQMPEMDGYAATRAIRETLGMQDIPIIAMTANAIAGDQEKCLAAGMNDYIPKPVDINRLFSTLAKWLTCDPPPPVEVSESSHANKGWPATLPGFHLAAGLTRVGGDQSFYLKMIRQFMQNHSQDITTLRQLLAEQNWQEMAKLVHMLKGLAGNLAAHELQQGAKDLEKAILSQHFNLLPVLLDGLESSMNLTLRSGRDLLNFQQNPPTSQAISKVDVEERERLLKELHDHLTVFNLRANDVFQHLATLFPHHASTPQWLTMRDLLDKLDYPQAITFLPHIVASLNRSVS
ncbi:MAG: response regulator [Magnetococcales bacterium]|nr:response regulator [Magnetococcales bacterium]NGZ26112.1 response regulator [Magnetococcales bacterium]